MTRSWWLAVIESYPCPSCGAAPGAKCIATSGHETHLPHAERQRAGERCKRCGAVLDAERLYGDLCEHCDWIRALEKERSTTWKRRH